MKTIIKASYIPQVAPFISNEKTRYYLNGVLIEPCESGKGARLVATDGHVMGIFHDVDGQTDKANIWPIAKTLLAACKPNHKDSWTRWLVIESPDVGAAIARVVYGADAKEAIDAQGPAAVLHQEFIQPIDGTFPDYKRIIPTLPLDRKCYANAYNPAKIAQFATAAAYESDGREHREKHALTIHGTSDVNDEGIESEGPAVIKISTREDFLGVLMPVRVDAWNKTPALPDWLAPAKTKKTEQAA